MSNNKPMTLNTWNMGGISESRILGENDRAMFKMIGTDIHSRIGLLQANRRLSKASSTTVDGFVKNSVACSDGYVYLFSSTSGKVWQYDPSDGSFTLVYTANSTVGGDNILGAYEYDNYLYFATQNYLYRIQLDYTGLTWSSYVEEVGKLNIDPVCGDSNYLGGDDYDTNLYAALIETSTVTFTHATNKVNLTGHSFVNGDIVQFTTTDTLPAELSASTSYYVVNKATNDFEVSLTSGGAAIDITDAGTGTHSVVGNASEGFIPQLKTQIGVAINIKTVPSTSITLTLHNSANSSIATKTVLAASLSTGINEIYWDSAITYEKGETYHLHIFQTGTGGEVQTAVADQMDNVYLEVYGASNSSYHPMIVLNGVLFIGDGCYIHQVENVLTLNALDLPKQYIARCLGKIGIDLLIGTEVSNSVHSAMIFRWNTWSVSWSIEDDIEEESINAFIPVDNYVYVIAGTRGNVYFYNGEKLELFRRIGGEFDSTDEVTVYPDAVSSLHGIPLIGVSSTSGDALETGVYGMGTANPRIFPRVFDLEYVTSQGMTGVEIGSIVTFGSSMLVSWKKTVGETTTYGTDAFDGTNLYSGAYIQTRVLYRDRNDRTTYRKAIINYFDIQASSDNQSTPETVTFDGATDVVELEDHGFQDGEPVVFAGGTLPTGITIGTTYYVVNKTDDTFQVSATSGGSAITLTGDGSGITTVAQVNVIRLYYRKDYGDSWVELDLLQDTDKKQFITESWGDYAFCIEIKLELRAKGSDCPIIDEITFIDE